MNDTTLETITLNNGGKVMFDKLAFEALKWTTQSFDYKTQVWETDICLSSDKWIDPKVDDRNGFHYTSYK